MNRWSSQRANEWAARLPWLVGCNYVPRSASNQLEMWQPETFDPAQIRQELGWAKRIGMNTLRIFLHDLLWQQDAGRFLQRIEQVLAIAAENGIGVMLVPFDSVWHPFPRLGAQREPEPHVHNSCWVQTPGVEILKDEKRFDQLESYVVGVISHFANDPRVHVWDLWNEPDNTNPPSYGPRDLGEPKKAMIEKYLPRVFEWARSAMPSQPLTSGVWVGNYESDSTLTKLERFQLEQSDVVTFHCYDGPDVLEEKIEQLSRYGRPMLCTEFMARPQGSTFQACLPVMKKHHVGAYCWGFVAGRSQTNYPWDSWRQQYNAEPDVWFHDIFRSDGSAYRAEEAECIATLTGAL